MSEEQRLHSLVLPPLLVALMVLFGVFLLAMHGVYQSQLRGEMEKVRVATSGLFQAEVRRESQLMGLELQGLLRNPLLRERFLAEDRERLLAKGQLLLIRLRDQRQVSQLTFLKPDGAAWLRVHEPQRHGDVVTHPGLVEARGSGQPASNVSLEEGGGFLLRVVVPWRDRNGTLLGYLELGKSLPALIGHIAETLGHDLLVVMDRRHLDLAHWRAGLVRRGQEERIAQWDRFGTQVVVDGTLGAVSPGVSAYLRGILDREPAVAVGLACGGGVCGAADFPLLNGAEEMVGRMVVIDDLTESAREASRGTWMVGVVCLVVGAGLFALIYWVLRRLEQRLEFSREKIDRYVAELEQANEELNAKQRQLENVSEGRQRAKRQLQEAYDHMEYRVEQRTAELSRAVSLLEKEAAQHRRTVELLRKSERRFETLARMAPVGIFHASATGQLHYANARWGELVGMAPGRVQGAHWTTILREEDRPFLRSEWRRASEEDVPFQFEYRFSEEAGGVTWVLCQMVTETDDDGKLVGSIGTLTDITDRKRTEVELLMLAAAIDQAAEIVYITDPRGMIQYANPAFERITGYQRQEIMGKSVGMLKSGRHDDAFFREMWRSLLRGEVWRGSIINRRKDGSQFETETNISPIHGHSGEIINFVAVARDVTTEVMLEKQLRQSQKLEAIGTLAGGIAHDFNNLLTPVLGFTEIALDQAPQGSRLERNLRMVMDAGLRAKDLVAQILMFNRHGEQAPQPLHLEVIVKEVLKLLRATLPATIKIASQVENPLPPVFADPTQMHQVLMNLCTNAAYAMREQGGVLAVSLRLLPPAEVFRGQEGKGTERPYLELGVKDDGQGMPAEVVERIFDPFFTTKPAGEGTGLGLSVVHGIIKAANGHIRVESQPGQGSLFRVLLPTIQEGEVREVHGSGPMPTGDESILFVDDEPLVAELGRQILKRLGYRVRVCTDPAEAWRLFSDDPQQFDLVITDHTMPTMTGGELATRMMGVRPELPVLLCTGFTDRMNEEQALAMGFRKFILKPLTPYELAVSIREALGD